MPISNISIISEVPPAEKKGSEMPVFGTRLLTTAMLRMVWMATWAVIPVTTRAEKRSGALKAMVKPRQMSRIKSKMMMQAPIKPSSSQTMEKMKSFCGSGI